jgi:hypothetical protein
VGAFGNFTICQKWGKIPNGAKIKGRNLPRISIKRTTSMMMAIVFPAELAMTNLLMYLAIDKIFFSKPEFLDQNRGEKEHQQILEQQNQHGDRGKGKRLIRPDFPGQRRY